MSEPATLSAEEREELVAYLDGELDDARTREIERSLTEREDLRRELESLQRTWDLLDLLPLERASGQFGERTMSVIQAEAVSEADSPPDAWRKRLRWGAPVVGWAAAIAAVAAVAFLSTNRWTETDADVLVRDLPVVEEFDAYGDAGSVEFLRKLHDSGVLDDFGERRHDD